MSAEFTDSVGGNVELIAELLAGMPHSARPRCVRAAVAIENVVNQMRKDSPKDPAVALGVAWAIFKIAEALVQPNESGQKSDGDKLILTL
jgi:hypothetical protein